MRPIIARLRLLAVTVLVALVRAYQLAISPFLGSNCRFWPSCSEYVVDALHKHGPVKGTWLGARRLSRCHPLHSGGLDPVP